MTNQATGVVFVADATLVMGCDIELIWFLAHQSLVGRRGPTPMLPRALAYG